MTTKKRTEAKPEAKKTTAKRTTKPAGSKPASKPASSAGARRPAVKTARRPAAKSAPKPRIHASHAEGSRPVARASGSGTLTPRPRSTTAARKTPLAAPKRLNPRRSLPPPTTVEASSAARELALALAAAGIDKKAVGIEILDVTGKVDYADFLVVMTGRSDRHVSSIASGIEDAMRQRKIAALSMEGLTSSTWVLIDFGDVVVHVFQEDARALYDIEGLWIDAGRIPVPNADKIEGGPARAGD